MEKAAPAILGEYCGHSGSRGEVLCVTTYTALLSITVIITVINIVVLYVCSWESEDGD